MVIMPCTRDCSISRLYLDGGKVPQQWKYAIIITLHKKKDRAKCSNYRGTSLVAHDRVGILPEEQSGFRPNHSTTDMMFVVRRLKKSARKKRISLYVCFIDLTKAYDSVDQTLTWTVLARFGVPQNMISAIRQFHDVMRVCARFDDKVCSGWFAVE